MRRLGIDWCLGSRLECGCVGIVQRGVIGGGERVGRMGVWVKRRGGGGGSGCGKVIDSGGEFGEKWGRILDWDGEKRGIE